MERTFKTVDPASGETIEELELHSAERIERTLAAAQSAFSAWRKRPMVDRSTVVRRVAQLLRDEQDHLARIAAREMGKPVTQGRAEVAKCARSCDYFAENAAAMLGDEAAPSDAAESYVVFDPLGVVLAIMPWNFPFWQVFRAAAPALMAGNTMVLKHALNVTRCALEIELLFTRAGAPDGLFQTLVIEHDTIPDLIRDDRIAAATLTGSERAGMSVGKEAGSVIKKTVLELGGSDPFVVLADADIEAAAETAVRSRFQNAGQSCIAAKRFFVEASVADAFTSRFVEKTRALRVGNPMDDATELGPLARADLCEEVDRQVRVSVEAGARALVGGSRRRGRGAFYEPTVLVDVPPNAAALTEEVFGPVAPIVVVRNADEGIARANESRYGLGANLWTRDIPRAKRLAREIASGSVFINGMTASDPRRPFGGIKKSGYGRELAAYGMREFMNIKTVWVGPPKGSAPNGAGVE